MSVEQPVDALTASVDELKGAVVSKKATLDASVADAQSATAQAQAAKANALSARDQAGAFKDAAYSAAQSAASAVAYQDLSAVALTKAATAVDVFIYDTSKDSDGGAWRHRCSGTSWYREPLNTATRGSRREFPAVAIIVVEVGVVRIYDADDPAIPMWMVFEGGYNNIVALGSGYFFTSACAKNGVLAVGHADGARAGLDVVNLITDAGKHYGTTEHPLNVAYGSSAYKGNIAQRNAAHWQCLCWQYRPDRQQYGERRCHDSFAWGSRGSGNAPSRTNHCRCRRSLWPTRRRGKHYRWPRGHRHGGRYSDPSIRGGWL